MSDLVAEQVATKQLRSFRDASCVIVSRNRRFYSLISRFATPFATLCRERHLVVKMSDHYRDGDWDQNQKQAEQQEEKWQ